MYNEIDLDIIDINSEPPAEEPFRQYYYMGKCQEWVQSFARRKGRRPTACIQTFGCQMNARDSEKLRGILRVTGYEEASEEEADFVIFNTCTVRENANTRVYGRLGQLKPRKKKNPHMMIGLCGCMMQEPEVVEKLKKSYGFVDIIFGTHNIYKFAELTATCLESQRMVIDIWKDTDRIVENLPNERKYPFKSGINIMFGCNNFCSYCIVPYVRGRERSRDPQAILQEIRRLSSDGVSEVTLDQPMTFAELLHEIEKTEGIRRIRFMTSHPKDLSDELIEIMGNSDKICKHLHLPVQSGSTQILKRMNRRYTKEQYLELVAKIRKAVPDISLTTDIIVGFPGETEADFEETLDLVRKVRYDSAFTFIYSKRTGTPAAAMEEQVPQYVIKRRFNRLLKEVQTIAAETCAVHQGTVQEALVESICDHDQEMVTGRLSNNLLVHFPGGEELIGKYVDVRLSECRGFYYIGRRADETASISQV